MPVGNSSGIVRAVNISTKPPWQVRSGVSQKSLKLGVKWHNLRLSSFNQRELDGEPSWKLPLFCPYLVWSWPWHLTFWPHFSSNPESPIIHANQLKCISGKCFISSWPLNQSSFECCHCHLHLLSINCSQSHYNISIHSGDIIGNGRVQTHGRRHRQTDNPNA